MSHQQNIIKNDIDLPNLATNLPVNFTQFQCASSYEKVAASEFISTHNYNCFLTFLFNVNYHVEKVQMLKASFDHNM